jgi:hypothetical protein
MKGYSGVTRGLSANRQRKPVEAAEKPQDEEQMPDPRMSAQAWAE